MASRKESPSRRARRGSIFRGSDQVSCLRPPAIGSEMPPGRQSRSFSRRQFIAGTLATGVTLWLPRSSAAHHDSRHWGTLREGVWDSRERDYKILEIFLTGGLSPWETFYVDDPGTNESDDTSSPESWRGSFGFAAASACDRFPGGGFSRAFPGDGSPVHFGFATRPLLDAPEGETPMWDRTRVVVVRHNQAPHEGGIPISLTGLRLGNPRMAGLGVPIDRHIRAGGGDDVADRVFPAAYFLEPGGTNAELDNAVSVGRHGPGYRPVRFPLAGAAEFRAALRRTTTGGGGSYDDLIDAYRASFTDALSHVGRQLRSKGLDGYSSARSSLGIAPTLEEIIGDTLDTPAEALVRCGSNEENYPLEQALDLALNLLNREGETQRAGYVGIAEKIDRYDGHRDNAQTTIRSLEALLSLLQRRVFPGDAGGPTLNLDDTMVVLTSEFGRTPWWQGGLPNGRNHHPEGSLSVLIGGPIPAGGNGYAGSMTSEGYAADDAFTPADVRAAVLMAAGIDPLETPDVFSISDLSRPANEEAEGDAARLSTLRERILGVVEA